MRVQSRPSPASRRGALTGSALVLHKASESGGAQRKEKNVKPTENLLLPLLVRY